MRRVFEWCVLMEAGAAEAVEEETAAGAQPTLPPLSLFPTAVDATPPTTHHHRPSHWLPGRCFRRRIHLRQPRGAQAHRGRVAGVQ